MSYIEENAYKSMVDIFSIIYNQEQIYYDCYFASDMYKINGKSYVHPCFLGFNNTSIAIVEINLDLEKEKVHIINVSSIKKIKIKKMFLSKNFYLEIKSNDNTSFLLAVPSVIKYIPIQQENIEKFLRLYQNY